MNKTIKKWMLASGLFGLLITLSGCVKTENGKPTGEGVIYKFLVEPMSKLILYFVEVFDGNYGIAIILFTLIVRAVILPLGLHQSKKASMQSEKMAFLKPQMDVIQAKQKAATTQDQQMVAQQELQAFYKDNNMSMLGGMGCLPLLIQMPIFTALFFTIKYMPGIEDQLFLGINLGDPSRPLALVAALSYLLQSYLGTIGLSEEQKKQMKTMMFMSPIMIGVVSWSSPAGVTIYWIVGGIFSCIQTLIANLYQKPKIRAQIAEEFRLNPPKVVEVPVVKEKKDVTPKQAKAPRNQTNQGLNSKPQTGRNAGRNQNR